MPVGDGMKKSSSALFMRDGFDGLGASGTISEMQELDLSAALQVRLQLKRDAAAKVSIHNTSHKLSPVPFPTSQATASADGACLR